MIEARPSAWFDSKAVRRTGPLRLICVPHAGGRGALFAEWEHWLRGAADVCPMHLPGRGPRLGERPHTSVTGLIDALMPALLPLADRPIALFGHSMGALIAFEAARALAARERPVRALIVAGCSAPQLPRDRVPLWDMPTNALVRRLHEFDGTPPELLDDPALRDLFLPCLRADFQMVDTYQLTPGPPLDCPILACAGAGDTSVSPEEIAAWAEQTRGRFSMQTFPGGHFFIRTSEVQILRSLQRVLAYAA